MIIKDAWSLKSLPTCYVVELLDGSLKMFYNTPLRPVKSFELSDYKGYHPRDCKCKRIVSAYLQLFGMTREGEETNLHLFGGHKDD